MKVFVTGISGFVGANLARRLLSLGHEVHGIVRPNKDPWRLMDISDNLVLHRQDLLDREKLHATLMAERPEVVYHTAVYGAYSSQKDADLILRTAVMSTFDILTAAKAAGVGMVVNTGSSSEYGTKDHSMREDEIVEPSSYYAIGKVAATYLGQYMARVEKLPVITMRPFSVYGPYEEPGRLVPTIIGKALDNEDILLADPATARDFIYVDDVVEGLIAASARVDLSGEVFNLGSGRQEKLEGLMEAVMHATGSISKLLWGAYPSGLFDTSVWVADMSKTKDLLSYQARTPLAEGLFKTVEWFKEHRNFY